MERAKHRLPQRPVRMRQGCRLTGLQSSVRVLHARSWFGFEPPPHSAFSPPHGSKKVISCDHSAGFMYACNHILALSGGHNLLNFGNKLGLLPKLSILPQIYIFLCLSFSVTLRATLGSTFMPVISRVQSMFARGDERAGTGYSLPFG